MVLIIREDELRRNLFNLISDSCVRIKFLHLDHLDLVNTLQLSKIIVNFSNYLKYLTLGINFFGIVYNDTVIDNNDDFKTVQ